MRLLELYRHTDPALARVLEERMGLDDRARGGMDGEGQSQTARRRRHAVRAYFAEAAGAAANSSRGADGPRVGALAFDGWDTHVNEGALDGRLAALLGALDGAIAAIENNMGAAWRETVVAIITEFGRTARINGTDGTDHGTGTVALLAGGALKGGRVLADWPGLRDADLHEGRDLKPTTDLRAVLKGCCTITCASTTRAGLQRVPGQRGRQADGGIAGLTPRCVRGRSALRCSGPAGQGEGKCASSTSARPRSR